MKPIVVIEKIVVTRVELSEMQKTDYFQQYLSFEVIDSDLIKKHEFKDFVRLKRDEIVIFGKKKLNGNI